MKSRLARYLIVGSLLVAGSIGIPKLIPKPPYHYLSTQTRYIPGQPENMYSKEKDREQTVEGMQDSIKNLEDRVTKNK